MYYMSAPLVRFWKSSIAITGATHLCENRNYMRATDKNIQRLI